MKRGFKIFSLALLITSLSVVNTVLAEENWRMILNLEGQWKFAIGDNAKWATPAYNDSEWETIKVPSNWEDQGFYGYNGFAWYRKVFDGTVIKNKSGSYNLFVGYIDDVDEVYLNGHKIGASGSFPPRYHTAYNALRNYFIPVEYINFNGKNTIAVRVFDSQVEGGIISGDVGIFVNQDDQDLAVNLRGMWDFTLTGKRYGEHHGNFNHLPRQSPPEKASWTKIPVPSFWDHQGFEHYDGGAWYRKQFTVPKELAGEDLVLLLGKIDDYDQTYLNGKLVGSTDHHDKLRIYQLPADMVNAGGVNLLMIFVEDAQGPGGMYQGPVGLIKQSAFTRYMRYRK